MNKVELLAPAGNLEKLKMAIIYGADAVYLGGKQFGLRAYADNFSIQEITEGVAFAHKRKKKVYLTLNIFAHNDDLENIDEYIINTSKAGVDAYIISDPGVISIINKTLPSAKVHLSTQANTTNWASAKFWYEQGVKRVVLAREISLEQVKKVRNKTQLGLEIEIFVHGSMCVSYSGRCLLSNYMVGRDSNRGFCAQPCRWKYHLVEEERPGEYFPVIEDERGTYIFNSNDLCLIKHIPEVISTGVSSIKIEGRMKSSYYVATVVKAYREAIDLYYKNPDAYEYNKHWLNDISKVSHRQFTTGFYFGKTTKEDQVYEDSSYIREYEFLGLVRKYDKKTGIAEIEQRNRIQTGDWVEFVNPKGEFFVQKIKWMKNEQNEIIDSAPHPQMIFFTPVNEEVKKYAMIRKESSQ